MAHKKRERKFINPNLCGNLVYNKDVILISREMHCVFFSEIHNRKRTFLTNSVKITRQPVDKDKIGSVPHFSHQDKFEMGV